MATDSGEGVPSSFSLGGGWWGGGTHTLACGRGRGGVGPNSDEGTGTVVF